MGSAVRVWTPYEDERLRTLALVSCKCREDRGTDKGKRGSGPKTGRPVEDRIGQADDEREITNRQGHGT